MAHPLLCFRSSMKRKKKSKPAVRVGKRSLLAKKAAKKAPKKAPMKAAAPKRPKKTARAKRAERRISPRLSPRGLWIREVQGDYQFTSEVRDISVSGIFLKKRIQSPGKQTQLVLNDGNGRIELEATVVRDDLTTNSLGTAYRFEGLSKDQLRSLRGFLRNLD